MLEKQNTNESLPHRAVGVYGGTVLLFRVSGWKVSSGLSILSMFSEPIVPLHIHENMHVKGGQLCGYMPHCSCQHVSQTLMGGDLSNTCTHVYRGIWPDLGHPLQLRRRRKWGHGRSVQISTKRFSSTGTFIIINLQRYGFLGIVPRSKLLPAPLSSYRLIEDSNNRSFITVYQTSTPGKTDFVSV